LSVKVYLRVHEGRLGTGVDAFYDNLQSRVTEFTLENGLHFIVLERHVAPVVSCHIYADVGAFDEQEGQTGGSLGQSGMSLSSVLLVFPPLLFLMFLHSSI
jgi:hypothetical protein